MHCIFFDVSLVQLQISAGASHVMRHDVLEHILHRLAAFFTKNLQRDGTSYSSAHRLVSFRLNAT